MVTVFPIKLFKMQPVHKGKFPRPRSVVVPGKRRYFQNTNGLNFNLL